MVFITGLVLSSCLEMTMDIQLNGESAGSVTLDALSYRMAQGLQIMDGDTSVPPLPATREEWTALLSTVPGTLLTAFEAKIEPLGTRTHTVVTFANSRALEALFAVFHQKAAVTLTGTVWNFSLIWQYPNFRGISRNDRELWTALWGDREWVVSLSVPRAVRIQGGGGVTDASRVTRRIKLSEFATDNPPAEWKISW